MKIKKRLVIFSLLFIILFLGIFFVKAAVIVSHSTGEFKIKIDGDDTTLQDAVSNDLFIGSHTYALPSAIPDPGHGPDEIWVSTDTGEKTLENALSTPGEPCKTSETISYSGPTDPSDLSKAYHYANEIEISPGTSFQDIIDSGEFCCVPKTCADLGCGTWDAGCGVTLNCGCPVGSECIGGQCCIKEDSFACDGNRYVYWYDSCGNREGVKQDCGTSYCGGWGGWYCIDGSTAQSDITCYNKGCSGSSCYSNSYIGDSRIARCLSGYRCVDGTCIEEGGKIISTELYHMGILNEEEYKMDVEYSHKHFSPEAIRGYQALAIPILKIMRKSPKVMQVAIPIAKAFIEEIAYRTGKQETGNEVGALFLDEGMPLCERIGVYINEPNWRSLFDESWLKEEVDPIYINTIKFAIGDNFFSTINIIRNILQTNNEDDKYDELVKNYFTEEKVGEMIYDALDRGNESDLAFVEALLDNLEESVEEIEAMVREIENNSA